MGESYLYTSFVNDLGRPNEIDFLYFGWLQ